MASRLLRNIAISIGAGLAAGFGHRLASRQACRPAPNLNPILTRLEDIESRVSRVELAPSVLVPAPEEIEALGTLVSSQSEDIASLRQDIDRIDRRNAELVEAFGHKVALLEQQVPVQIEASISARMAELEQKLRGEFHQVHHRTVDAFADTIEKRVVGRIAALEASLVDQSHSIVSLREKSVKTEDNLQRLLEAVERLCARAESQSQVSLVQPAAPAATPRPPELPPPVPPVAVERVPEPAARPEPEFAFAGASQSNAGPPPPPRIGIKPVGMAILGLAILGFRLIR